MHDVAAFLNPCMKGLGFIPPAKKARVCDFTDSCDSDDDDSQRSELSDYVNMKVSKGVDMMDCWRDNRSVLPKMFWLARRILCIPASSAASERVFSAAGRLLEKRRTNLAPDSVNSLLFLNSNM